MHVLGRKLMKKCTISEKNKKRIARFKKNNLESHAYIDLSGVPLDALIYKEKLIG